MDKMNEKIAKWNRNKKGLGFSAVIRETDNHRLSVTISHCKKEYLKAVTALAKEIMRDALQDIAANFVYEVAPQDRESEEKKIASFLHSNTVTYLNLLLSDERAYYTKLQQDTAMFQLKYEAEHAQFSEEGWKRWNGQPAKVENPIPFAVHEDDSKIQVVV